MLLLDPTLLLIWGGTALFGALIGLRAADRKGFSPVSGFIGGALLGILAPLMFFVTSERRRCPHCREWVDPKATVCRACRRDVEAPAPEADVPVIGEARPRPIWLALMAIFCLLLAVWLLRSLTS